MHPLVDGAYTHKQQEDQPLVLEARRNGFVTLARSISPEELAKLGNKVSLELEREKPKLPESLVAKPGADLDPDVQLPSECARDSAGRCRAAGVCAREAGHVFLRHRRTAPRRRTAEARVSRSSSRFMLRSTKSPMRSTSSSRRPRARRRPARVGKTRRRNGPQPLNLDPLKNSLPVTNVSSEQAAAFCHGSAGGCRPRSNGRAPSAGQTIAAIRCLGARTSRRANAARSSSASWARCPSTSLPAGTSPLGLSTRSATRPSGVRTANNRAASSSAVAASPRPTSTTSASPGAVTGDARGEEDTGFRVVIPIDASRRRSGPVSSSIARHRTRSERSQSILAGRGPLLAALGHI